MMLYSRNTGRILLMLAVAGILALPTAGQVNDSLYQAIDDACTKAESALIKALPQKWEPRTECEPGDGFNEELCRLSYAKLIRDETEKAVAAQVKDLRKDFWAALAGQPADQVNPFHQAIDPVADRLSEAFPHEDVIEKRLKGLGDEALQDKPDLSSISKAAVAGFGQTCRTHAVAAVAAEGTSLSRLTQDDGSDYLASLRKETGFSQVVRCVWQRDGSQNYLDCAPGLRVTGHDIAVIQILPPADNDFRLRWVQAIGSEEIPADLDNLHCPGYDGVGDTSLTCDELCFEKEGPCLSTTDRLIETQSAKVAVHTKRRFSTTYGCAWGGEKCAHRRLRQDRAHTQPAKLTLLTKGRAPVIRVRAMDQNGEIAEGEVLVGYQRWRVETGGFLAVTEIVDEKVVTKPATDDTTKLEVFDIRDSDSYAQETGIFVNLIPSNYELIGASLGFATADGKAPSVYLGPTIRLRTFGNRGLAALSFGGVLRQVDRFPDLRRMWEDHSDPASSFMIDPDSRFLEPDRHFEVDYFIGIQLGFSFGPISVPDSED